MVLHTLVAETDDWGVQLTEAEPRLMRRHPNMLAENLDWGTHIVHNS